MKLNKTILATITGVLVAGAITYAVVSPTKATKDNATSISKTFTDSLKATLHKRAMPNAKTQGKEDSIVDAAYAGMAKGFAGQGIYDTVVVVPPVVTPPNTGTNPGGKASGNLVISNETGKKRMGLTFDGGNKGVVQILIQNCVNDTIMLCTFKNCQGYSIRAVNCKNIVVINNFFTKTNFGARFEQCVGVKFNGNQLLNLNGPAALWANNFAHFMQAYQCTGHQEYNDNISENVLGVAVRPHDIFSIDACSGSKGDSIQVKRCKFRGGQQSPYPNDGALGGGAMGPDESGSYYSITDNIFVSCGTAAWQAVGSGSAVRFANNIIYNNSVYPSARDGFSIQGNKTAFVVENNRIYWRNKNNNVGDKFTGGETVYWLGSPNANPVSMGITMRNNKYDTTLTPDVLPKVIITYHL